jgi:hypothetical protein
MSRSELSATPAAPQHHIAALVAFAPISLLLPSHIAAVDRTKLALLGAVAATFFLFAAQTWFPGGAEQFVEYADAIIHGTKLLPDIASRDAGYPLLIILSGYTVFDSLIPLFLIQAALAIMLPVLIYEGLRRLSPTIAFFTGLVSIGTLSPFYFMKMIHHDQTYIFFAILMLCQLMIFAQTGRMRFLYFFTAAAICASVARPSGNALFPLFLIVGYIAVRGSIAHYLACAAIFAASVVGYAWHRQIIFDQSHAASTPSYLGEQLFYNPYLNALDYDVPLRPQAIGPNFTMAIAQLRARLEPNPRDSKFIRTQYVGPPDQATFAETDIAPFTTDQLIDRVLTLPNWEYYTLLCLANDDRVLLAASLEMARANPMLIVRYSTRNLVHFIFEPGYKHSRYNLNPFRPEGLFFYPAVGNVAGATFPLPARAIREITLDPVSHEPFIVHRVFSVIETAWLASYRTGEVVMAVLMCAAWLAAAANLLRAVRGQAAMAAAPPSTGVLAFAAALTASIVISSLVFGYNAAVTAIFAEPDFRYRQAADLQGIIIAGLGVIALARGLGPAFDLRLAAGLLDRWNDAVRFAAARDVWRRFTSVELASAVIGVTVAGFSAWTLFMVANTSP